jgi:hypothetical protein
MSADGPILDALTAARAMLRDCYWWRRLANPVTPWNQATAEEHIHFDGLPPPSPGPDHSLGELTLLRPFAIMWTEQSAGLRIRNETAGYCCAIPSGIVVVQIEFPVPAGIANQPSAVAEYASRAIGRIMRTCDANQPGLFELSGLAGYLPLNEIQLIGYARPEKKTTIELGDFVLAELQLNWGLE